MSILRCLPIFKNTNSVKRNEHIEKLKDEFYDSYYTNCAKNHLNRILKTYNRKSHHSFEKSLNAVKHIGLYQPCSDSINYLKNMRWVSTKPRKQ
jgi:hypothetical protein